MLVASGRLPHLVRLTSNRGRFDVLTIRFTGMFRHFANPELIEARKRADAESSARSDLIPIVKQHHLLKPGSSEATQLVVDQLGKLIQQKDIEKIDLLLQATNVEADTRYYPLMIGLFKLYYEEASWDQCIEMMLKMSDALRKSTRGLPIPPVSWLELLPMLAKNVEQFKNFNTTIECLHEFHRLFPMAFIALRTLYNDRLYVQWKWAKALWFKMAINHADDLTWQHVEDFSKLLKTLKKYGAVKFIDGVSTNYEPVTGHVLGSIHKRFGFDAAVRAYALFKRDVGSLNGGAHLLYCTVLGNDDAQIMHLLKILAVDWPKNRLLAAYVVGLMSASRTQDAELVLNKLAADELVHVLHALHVVKDYHLFFPQLGYFMASLLLQKTKIAEDVVQRDLLQAYAFEFTLSRKITSKEGMQKLIGSTLMLYALFTRHDVPINEYAVYKAILEMTRTSGTLPPTDKNLIDEKYAAPGFSISLEQHTALLAQLQGRASAIAQSDVNVYQSRSMTNRLLVLPPAAHGRMEEKPRNSEHPKQMLQPLRKRYVRQ